MSTTTQTPRSEPATTHSRRPLLRHYVEMVIAMLVGMAVIGGIVRAAVGIAGLTYSLADQPELSVLEMAVDMSIGMVVWMRHRGHGWASTLEMAGAMVAPGIALLPLLWLGALDGESLMMAEHLVMLPLMYVVMLRRRHEYGGHSHV